MVIADHTFVTVFTMGIVLFFEDNAGVTELGIFKIQCRRLVIVVLVGIVMDNIWIGSE